jgi:hypothetical protein
MCERGEKAHVAVALGDAMPEARRVRSRRGGRTDVHGGKGAVGMHVKKVGRRPTYHGSDTSRCIAKTMAVASESGVRVRRPPGWLSLASVADLFWIDRRGMTYPMWLWLRRSMGTVVGPYPVAVASAVGALLPGWRHMYACNTNTRPIRR